MRPPQTSRTNAPSRGLLWDLLTFDRLITGPVVHLIYWAGLGVIVLMAFGVIGTAIGLALLWRAVCEFYVAIFRISDDLRALRLSDEADHRQPPV